MPDLFITTIAVRPFISKVHAPQKAAQGTPESDNEPMKANHPNTQRPAVRGGAES